MDIFPFCFFSGRGTKYRRPVQINAVGTPSGVSEGNKTMLLVDSGKTTVPYALGEIKKLEQSSDYLKIKTSDAGTTQLKMLPVAKDSSIVCIIKTVCAEACDSHISFYTTNGKK
jgi:hypothetical protein